MFSPIGLVLPAGPPSDRGFRISIVSVVFHLNQINRCLCPLRILAVGDGRHISFLIKDAKVPPSPPGAIEARVFFRQPIRRTGAREKTLFPNEASNYQLGGQFAAVGGFVLDRARDKAVGCDLPPERFAQTPAVMRWIN